MAIAGRNATIFVDKIDASDYLNEFEAEQEGDDIDVSTFGNKKKKYLAGPSEVSLTLTGHWDGDDGDLDDLLDASFGGDVENIITICPAGVTSGKACYLAPGVQLNNNISAEVDDVTELEAEFRASAFDRARILQGPTSITATGNGTESIATALTSKGGAAHLHVLSAAGTTPSVTVVVEHSVDGTTWAPLISFDAATAPGSQRGVTSSTATVNVQVRAKWTVTGTTPDIVLVVAFSRFR